MTEPFHARLPTLTEAELRRYLERPQGYKAEAVEAAIAELARRGCPLPEVALTRVRQQLRERELAEQAARDAGASRFLGATPQARLRRIRRLTGGLLATGLGSAILIYLVAAPAAPNPLGYEPEDTKRYLRQLEVVGGKANVVATEFQRWFEGLWQGRQLAFTVAWLTVILALGFWFLATRLAVDPDDPTPPAGG